MININTGDIFNNLTIIRELNKKTRNRTFECECKCGNRVNVQLSHLRSGSTKGCGCGKGKQNIRHGLSKNPLHHIWVNMRARCNNKNHQSYKDYGGRGIKVCDEWNKFETFFNDMNVGYKKGLQIERIDNDGNYCKENCKWATKKEQARNRRSTITYKGKCIAEWAEILGICHSAVLNRIRKKIKLNEFELC